MENIVPYDVVYISSEDKEFPVTGLDRGKQLCQSAGTCGSLPRVLPETGSRVKGWLSAPNAPMPQSIVLRFSGNVELTQLRILSHENKIASKMEVRLFALKCGDKRASRSLAAGKEDEVPSFRTVRFAKLGTIEFNSNEQSNYRSKERKTVHLQARAYFVKLLFNTPHRNAHNRLGQVGVYSIECVGHILSRVPRHVDVAIAGDASSPYSPSSPKSMRSAHQVATPQKIDAVPSPRGVDPQFATPICDMVPHNGEIPAYRSVRIMEFEDFFLRRTAELLTLKAQAVAVEDFETATICRNRINRINRRSKRIYQLEQDKVHAIIEEDFEAAKSIKAVMDALIEKVHRDAQVPQPRSDFDPYECSSDTVVDDRQRGKQAEGEQCDGTDRLPASTDRSAANVKDCSGLNNISEALEDDSSYSLDFDELDSAEYHDSAKGDDEDVHDDPSGKSTGQSSRNVSPRGKGTGSPGGHSDNAVGVKLPIVTSCARQIEDLVNNLVSKIDAAGSLDEFDCGSLSPNGAKRGDASKHGTPTTGKFPIQTWERPIVDEIMRAAGDASWPSPLAFDIKNKREVLDLSDAVGVFTTTCLYSSHFKLREAALNVLTDRTGSLYGGSPSSVEGAVLRYLDQNSCGMQDTIPNVVAAACVFVRMVLADEHGCIKSVAPLIVNLLPRLLCAAADGNARVREESITTLTLYVKTPAITNANLLTAVFADPVDKERRRLPPNNHRAQLARLTVLQLLLENGDLKNGNAAVVKRNIEGCWSKVLLPCLNHQQADVRDLALSITSQLLRDKKLVLTEKRKADIHNPAIRDELCSAAGKSRQESVSKAIHSPSTTGFPAAPVPSRRAPPPLSGKPMVAGRLRGKITPK
uniref:Uncharacterized protein n=1 Tax=Trypanosoma vivax (strain Y486) TaxID=1055687 RepID=G0TW35_TRYVY|nr:conserved hypothetical protein [Trypanosoma vivax Y486]